MVSDFFYATKYIPLRTPPHTFPHRLMPRPTPFPVTTSKGVFMSLQKNQILTLQAYWHKSTHTARQYHFLICVGWIIEMYNQNRFA